MCSEIEHGQRDLSFACQGSAAYEAERLVAKASPVPFPVVLRESLTVGMLR